MRAIQVIAFFLLAFTAGVFAQNTATSTSPVAYAYVGQNVFSTPQEVSAFAVFGNGSVAKVTGSPFAGPSGSLVVSSGFVFGTDSTNIQVYRRLANGGLTKSSSIDGTAHNDTPQGSAVDVMSLDRTANSLYAGEINFQGADNAAYAEFANLHNGTIVWRANTTINVDFHSALEFSENDQFAYGIGCFFANWDVFAFHRLTDGGLVQFDPGTTFPPNPSGDLLCPGSAAASAQGFLAISYGPANTGSKQNIITYRITSTGGLETNANSVVATNFTGLNLRFDPTGHFLAAAGQNGIELFRLNTTDGALTRIGSLLEPTVTLRSVLWDDSGHVFAISNSALYVFTLHSTGLTLNGIHPVTNAGSLAVLPTI